MQCDLTLCVRVQMILKHPEDAPLDQRIRRHRLCLALVLVSQGVAFIHAGDPLLRSKSLDRDSYNSGVQLLQCCLVPGAALPEARASSAPSTTRTSEHGCLHECHAEGWG